MIIKIYHRFQTALFSDSSSLKSVFKKALFLWQLSVDSRPNCSVYGTLMRDVTLKDIKGSKGYWGVKLTSAFWHGSRFLDEGVRWHPPPEHFEISSPQKRDFCHFEAKSACCNISFLKDDRSHLVLNFKEF